MAISAYEALRQGNITRNNEMLHTLGLTSKGSASSALLPTTTTADVKKSTLQSRQQKRKRVNTESTNNPRDEARRSSRRLQNQQEGLTLQEKEEGMFVAHSQEAQAQVPAQASRLRRTAVKTTADKKYGTIMHPKEMLSENDGFDVSTVVDKWDSSKVHQHLTLSPSRCTVVTTGCAGKT